MTTTRRFRTNINCGSCVARVSPFLNKEPSISRWAVDTGKAEKVLTVEGENFTAETVRSAIERAGYRVIDEIPA